MPILPMNTDLVLLALVMDPMAGKLNQDIRRSKNALPSTMMPLVSDKTSRIILEHYNSIIYGYCTIVYLAQLHMHVDVLQVSITTITLYYTLN